MNKTMKNIEKWEKHGGPDKVPTRYTLDGLGEKVFVGNHVGVLFIEGWRVGTVIKTYEHGADVRFESVSLYFPGQNMIKPYKG